MEIAFATGAGSAAATVAAAAATVGNHVKVTVSGKTYTVELVANASQATSAAKVAIGTTGSRLSEGAFAQALNEPINKQIEASNAAKASAATATAAYTTTGNVNIGWDGQGFTGGTANSLIGESISVDIGGKTFTVEFTAASVALGEGKVQVKASTSASAALAAAIDELKAQASAANEAGAAGNTTDNKIDTSTLTLTGGSDGSITASYATTEMKSNAPEVLVSGTKTFEFEVGRQTIKLDLGVGTYSGADIAKMVAEKLNQLCPPALAVRPILQRMPVLRWQQAVIFQSMIKAPLASTMRQMALRMVSPGS